MTPKQPKYMWVLRQTRGIFAGWYWCGLGNPMSKDAKEGTTYFTKKDAKAQAKYMWDELDMQHFTPEKVTGVFVAGQRLLARQRLNAQRHVGSLSRTPRTTPTRACTL